MGIVQEVQRNKNLTIKIQFPYHGVEYGSRVNLVGISCVMETRQYIYIKMEFEKTNTCLLVVFSVSFNIVVMIAMVVLLLKYLNYLILFKN